MGRLKEAFFYEICESSNCEQGITPEEFATSHPQWFSKLGKAVELVISLDHEGKHGGGNLYGISRWLAVEAIINKREPCRGQAREALGMSKEIINEIPF